MEETLEQAITFKHPMPHNFPASDRFLFLNGKWHDYCRICERYNDPPNHAPVFTLRELDELSEEAQGVDG